MIYTDLADGNDTKSAVSTPNFALHPVSPQSVSETSRFKQLQCLFALTMALAGLSFQGRSSSWSQAASLLQAIDGVMPLALCPRPLHPPARAAPDPLL